MLLKVYFVVVLKEDRTRVEIFHEYANKTKESVWGPFLNLLNRQDGFITNMTARIIAKIACWAQTPMERSDLHFYLTWLKDQLKMQVQVEQLCCLLYSVVFEKIHCNYHYCYMYCLLVIKIAISKT